MIPYEELDRALARWKSRSQAGASLVESSAAPEPILEAAADETPPPISADDLDLVAEEPPVTSHPTGEIDLADVESYEDNEN
ncbi:MAG TPA: hypothetical protein VHG72_04400 [Polyangia bacterium]|nr:hypothetical protein [Polyangia bacterium]